MPFFAAHDWPFGVKLASKAALRLVHLQRFDNGLDVLDPSPVLAPAE